MYVINTKDLRLMINLKFVEIIFTVVKTFDFNNEEIIFSDETLREIIEKYTSQEEGDVILKCIETIVSKLIFIC